MADLESERMEYSKVQSNMDTLNGIFSEYMTLLTEMNDVITSNVNSGGSSALDSVLGTDFLTNWSECASTFNAFKAEFDNLYADVSTVTQNNMKNEEATINAVSEL